VSAWRQRDGSGSREERHAFVRCDRCLPARVTIGTEARVSELGWRFEGFEHGPHVCPWCAHRRDRGLHRLVPAQERPALPNLLVIGAAKCGTTSFHGYLAAHPEIFMSEAKELRFFDDAECLDKLDIYATFFNRDAPVRGESTPHYAYHPLIPGVAERIRSAIPDTKLIYLVGDPIERAISHYVQECEGQREKRPLKQALGDLENPYNRYVAVSSYTAQLDRYRRLFPLEQLMVIDQVDLLTRRQETLSKVFRFLGVDDGFVSPEFEKLLQTRDTRVRWTGVGWSLRQSRLAEALRVLPARPREVLFGPVRRATTRKFQRPTVEPELRRRLREAFRDDVDRLRESTGQEFASWQV
jgi:Sulfotransferase domain